MVPDSVKASRRFEPQILVQLSECETEAMDITRCIQIVSTFSLQLVGCGAFLSTSFSAAGIVRAQQTSFAEASFPEAFQWEDTEPWQRHAVDDTLRGADGVRLADANGDGLLDIVTGWEESGRVRAYFHPGVDAVREAWPRVDIGRAPSVEDAVWVDLNGDGQLDVLSSCEGKEQSLRAHLAPPNKEMLLDSSAWRTEVIDCSEGVTRWMFATPYTQANSRSNAGDSVALADGNSTGPIAIVVASKNPGGMVGILYRASKEAEWKLQKLVDAAWVMSLDVVDVDGDGDLDILYDDRKTGESGVFYLENVRPDLSPWDERRWSQQLIGGSGREVMFMDFLIPTRGKAGNEPARPTIVAPAKPHSLLFFGRSQDNSRKTVAITWQTQEILLQPTSEFGFAKSVALGDLNADGKDDFVFACESAESPKSGVVCFIRDTDVWRARSVSGPKGIKFDLLKLVDLDGDSDLDILTCEEREGGRGLGIIWYENPSRF